MPEPGGETAAHYDPLRIEYVAQTDGAPISRAESDLALAVGRVVTVRAVGSILTTGAVLRRAAVSGAQDPEVIDGRGIEGLPDDIPTLRCVYPAPKKHEAQPPDFVLLDLATLDGAYLNNKSTIVRHCTKGLLHAIEQGFVEGLKWHGSPMIRGGLVERSADDFMWDVARQVPTRKFPRSARELAWLVELTAGQILLGATGGKRLRRVSLHPRPTNYVLPYGYFLRQGDIIGA